MHLDHIDDALVEFGRIFRTILTRARIDGEIEQCGQGQGLGDAKRDLPLEGDSLEIAAGFVPC